MKTNKTFADKGTSRAVTEGPASTMDKGSHPTNQMNRKSAWTVKVPAYPFNSSAKDHLFSSETKTLESSTQPVFGPRKDLPNMHQNVSSPRANLATPGKFNAMQIVMSVLFVAITYFLANVYIDNHVHRQLAFLNRYRVEHTRMNTTVNVVIHYTMDLNGVKMDQNGMNDDILASVASILKLKSSLIESSTEQKLTNFDLDKFVEAETTAVDGERKTSTKATGAKAVSRDFFFCILNYIHIH